MQTAVLKGPPLYNLSKVQKTEESNKRNQNKPSSAKQAQENR